MSVPRDQRSPDPVLFAPGPGGSWRVPRGPTPATDLPSNRTETSRAAARSMRSHARSIEAKVLAWFIGRGLAGGTNDECEQALELKTQTVTARTNRLVKLGLLGNSGRHRRTRSGRKAIVWTARTAGEGEHQ